MITVITKFEAKNGSASSFLLNIFQELLAETSTEQGYIDYQVLSDQRKPFTYYILEKWQMEEDLKRHAVAVEAKGYVAQATALIKNTIESIILHNIKI